MKKPHLSPLPPDSRKKPRPCVLLALGWYAPAIHRGIARYARQTNWMLDLSMTRTGLTPRGWRGDGIISILHWEPALYDLVKSSTKPVVNIGDLPLAGRPRIRCDDALIGQMAANHFIERDFRNAAFYLRSDAPSSRRRCMAFEKRFVEAGGRFYLIDWLTRNGRKREYAQNALIDWMGRQLGKLPKPLAIFSEHDECAIEVLYSCQSRGIPVPEQVAVLGVGDDKLRCEFAPVPLSSIDSNQEAIGYEAAAALDRLFRGEPAPAKPIKVPPIGITTRLSTDILAVNHPHVASALLHIWQNFTKPINAKTVAATVPISYRRLHDAFIEHVGRTIADEITWKRMESARLLLVNTEKRSREIATEVGFPNEDRMGRIFKRNLGMTPKEYRQKNRASGRANSGPTIAGS